MRARPLWRAPANFKVTTEWAALPVANDRACACCVAKPVGCMLFGAIVAAPDEYGGVRVAEARRLAAEGFIVLAFGGSEPPTAETAREDAATPRLLDGEMAALSLQAGFDYLESRLDVDADCIGALGYGSGGEAVLSWAPKLSRLACAVVVCAPPAAIGSSDRAAPIELAPRIRCPTQIHLAEDDEAIPPERIPLLERSLERRVSQPPELYIYPGAARSHMDCASDRYSPETADLVYRRMATFYRRHLGDWSAP
jgi:dienelactone hydrolase